MKKLFFVSLMTILGVFTLSNTYAQAAREERRAIRNAENAALDKELSAAIKAQDFVFVATEIQSTQNPMVQSVPLNSLYEIWVTPQQFKAYLPIYGSGSYNGQPTLLRRMDFFTSKYSYDIAPYKGQNTGWTVTMNVMDTWSLNTYTFQLNVTPNGNNSTLIVSSTFRAPVTFQGYVRP